jgi:putative flippase GtrA
MMSVMKWGLKAGGGLAANVALLTVWVDGLGIQPWAAIPINFVLISLAGYTLTNRWIWPGGVSPSSWREHLRQYLGMQAANFGGKTANYALYLVLLPVADYRLAWVAGAGATFLLTYVLNRYWWTQRSAIAESA